MAGRLMLSNIWSIGQTTVYWGRGRNKRRYGYLVSTSTRRFRQHDTWVAYDNLWHRVGCGTSKEEATSMVLRHAKVWR